MKYPVESEGTEICKNSIEQENIHVTDFGSYWNSQRQYHFQQYIDQNPSHSFVPRDEVIDNYLYHDNQYSSFNKSPVIPLDVASFLQDETLQGLTDMKYPVNSEESEIFDNCTEPENIDVTDFGSTWNSQDQYNFQQYIDQNPSHSFVPRDEVIDNYYFHDNQYSSSNYSPVIPLTELLEDMFQKEQQQVVSSFLQDDTLQGLTDMKYPVNSEDVEIFENCTEPENIDVTDFRFNWNSQDQYNFQQYIDQNPSHSFQPRDEMIDNYDNQYSSSHNSPVIPLTELLEDMFQKEQQQVVSSVLQDDTLQGLPDKEYPVNPEEKEISEDCNKQENIDVTDFGSNWNSQDQYNFQQYIDQNPSHSFQPRDEVIDNYHFHYNQCSSSNNSPVIPLTELLEDMFQKEQQQVVSSFLQDDTFQGLTDMKYPVNSEEIEILENCNKQENIDVSDFGSYWNSQRQYIEQNPSHSFVSRNEVIDNYHFHDNQYSNAMQFLQNGGQSSNSPHNKCRPCSIYSSEEISRQKRVSFPSKRRGVGALSQRMKPFRPRPVFSAEQTKKLEETFSQTQYLKRQAKHKLCAELGLDMLQIENWFCHRRMKMRRQQSVEGENDNKLY